MKATEVHSKTGHILYDAELIENPTASYFEPESWRKREALTGAAEGRGTAVFIHFAGQEYVLRHYQRGGMIARLVKDRYIWRGLSQTRAWREWHLLAELWEKDLPVPQPVAARVARQGLFYRADILICRIPETQTLADLLMNAEMDAACWKKLGQVLRHFHDLGVFHADLNARNILRDEQGEFHLIDFDRGCMHKSQQRLQQANCLRLRRSLDKFSDQAARSQTGFYLNKSDWHLLLQGYEGNS